MRTRAFHLTAAEIAELKQAEAQTKRRNELLWMQAARLFGSGMAVAQIKAVNDLLAAHPHVETVFFPPASPQLNPQEHVWSLARARVSHNHTLPDLPSLMWAFLRYLGSACFRFDWLSKYASPILLRHL